MSASHSLSVCMKTKLAWDWLLYMLYSQTVGLPHPMKTALESRQSIVSLKYGYGYVRQPEESESFQNYLNLCFGGKWS